MDQQKGDAQQVFVENRLWLRCRYRDVQQRERKDKPGRLRQFVRVEFCRHPEQPQGVYGGGCKGADARIPMCGRN